MTGLEAYLAGLTVSQAQGLAHVNGPGVAALRGYLASGEAVAFVGAGASAPMYPLWNELIAELVGAAEPRLGTREAATCRVLAGESPEEVVEVLRSCLGTGTYREVLREVLRVRTDPKSGHTWTPVQEIVCRCAFKAVVTTNYDPGIVDARMRVRLSASATGFTTWEDELGLDRWRTGDVFGDAELPVLFAHGQHNRPDSVVLATTEYRRAYAGKLSHVLSRLIDSSHLVWIGFSFADQRIAAILREIADKSGTRIDPGMAARHVAIMPWDPVDEGNDPRILARRAQISYGAQVVLYPAPDRDHSALLQLLSGLADPRFPPPSALPARTATRSGTGDASTASHQVPKVTWVTSAELAEHFTGRAEELARLDRWAADPEVGLIGVTAWGGAGKTALVTHWIYRRRGALRRPGVRGVFGWSFYSDPSPERWADALIKWADRELGISATDARSAAAVLTLLRTVPLLLVLDGLEVIQEGPAGRGFGRLLDGMLREVLSGACQLHHSSLVVLTSRFPFADLESFDGSRARTLEVPPFTPVEGSALLATAGGDWLPDKERRALVQAVDGHALATGVLAGVLAARPSAKDLTPLLSELAAAARTDARVGRVLRFYSDRLSEPDRYLVAAVSLFTRAVSPKAALTVARHPVFGGHLSGWTTASVEEAVKDRLSGLLSWHPDGTIAAHPLVRDAFRPLGMGAVQAVARTALTGIPGGVVTSRTDALKIVETIELLLDADEWLSADDLYSTRTNNGNVFVYLPAARLGQRAASAFVASATRREACTTRLGANRLLFYINEAGLFAKNAGDLYTAQEFQDVAVNLARDDGDRKRLFAVLQNRAECLGYLGEIGPARDAAIEALAHAESAGNKQLAIYAHAYLGWLAGMSGDSARAEEQFIAADQIQITDDLGHLDLHSLDGVWWAEWLLRTRRASAAQALTESNRKIASKNRWTDDVARCDRLLGRIALNANRIETAGENLAAAARYFRKGDCLTELAMTLTDLAEYNRVAGNFDSGQQHATEAITIAAPRGMVPAQSAALAVRARICACRIVAPSPAHHLAQGRDAADAALRLATRHHLSWHELDALHAHAALDQAEGTDRGWTTKASALHSRLVLRRLDPDPPGTVRRQTAAIGYHRTQLRLG